MASVTMCTCLMMHGYFHLAISCCTYVWQTKRKTHTERHAHAYTHAHTNTHSFWCFAHSIKRNNVVCVCTQILDKQTSISTAFERSKEKCAFQQKMHGFK